MQAYDWLYFHSSQTKPKRRQKVATTKGAELNQKEIISTKKKKKEKLSKEEQEVAKELAQASERRKSRVMEAFGSATGVTVPGTLQQRF